jgi:gamma-glutamylputrescine oxidase
MTIASPYSFGGDDMTATPPLAGEVRAEICVVGGGLFGLSAALHLARAGRDVVLLEAERVGGGASGRSGGQILPGFSADPATLIAAAGAPEARALWRWTRESIALVRELVAAHAIDCALADGVIAGAVDAAGAQALAREQVLIATTLGDDSLEALEATAAGAAIGSPLYRAALRDRGAANLDPLAFARGLARAACAAGVRLHEHTRVGAIAPGAPLTLATPAGHVRADQVVLATNTGTGALDAISGRHALTVWTFVVATEPLVAEWLLPGGEAVYEAAAPMSYYRRAPDGRLIFGAEGRARPLATAQIVARLGARLRATFPRLGSVALTHAWSGAVDVTLDRLPQFRRDGGRWIGHGFSGHGLALAIGAGRAVAQAIGGDTNAFARLAAIPSRPIPLRRAMTRIGLPLGLAWLRLARRLQGPRR